MFFITAPCKRPQKSRKECKQKTCQQIIHIYPFSCFYDNLLEFFYFCNYISSKFLTIQQRKFTVLQHWRKYDPAEDY